MGVIVILLGIGGVAFLTLLERKALGLSQVRLGPNKLTLVGILQPVSDGVKLLSKEALLPLLRQNLIFFLSPFLLLIVFCCLWIGGIPWRGFILTHRNSSLLYFSFLGVGTYGIILAGWNVIRSFSKLGGLRGILQRLSYEVALILTFMIILVGFNSLIIKGVEASIVILLAWLALWFLLSIMETNRAPFDLLEGERELIRGFNIEIGRVLFVYLFLTEYGIIIIIALIASFGVLTLESWLAFLICLLILIRRSCYPRMRYDILIGLIWQRILPISLVGFFISVYF